MNALYKNYSYHDFLFSSAEGFLQTIETIVSNLTPHKDLFDSIAIRGMSGAMVGPIVAAKLGKEITIIRKPGTSHADEITGLIGGKYIILDDFIEYGDTVQIIKKTLHKKMEIVGIYLYKRHCFVTKNFEMGEFADTYKAEKHLNKSIEENVDGMK